VSEVERCATCGEPFTSYVCGDCFQRVFPRAEQQAAAVPECVRERIYEVSVAPACSARDLAVELRDMLESAASPAIIRVADADEVADLSEWASKPQEDDERWSATTARAHSTLADAEIRSGSEGAVIVAAGSGDVDGLREAQKLNKVPRSWTVVDRAHDRLQRATIIDRGALLALAKQWENQRYQNSGEHATTHRSALRECAAALRALLDEVDS